MQYCTMPTSVSLGRTPIPYVEINVVLVLLLGNELVMLKLIQFDAIVVYTITNLCGKFFNFCT